MARPLSITLEIEANELRRRIALGDTAPVDKKSITAIRCFVCIYAYARNFFWNVLET
mgnify:CR=1 FL=1